MKIVFFEALILMFLSASFIVSGAQKLISNGKSDYVIVLPDDAIPAEVTAANELKTYIKSIAGVELPVVRAKEFKHGKMLAVGFNSKLPDNLKAEKWGALGPEELIISSDGNIVLLGGGRPRGSLYAVYQFLEMQGVHWYTPTYTHIPANKSIAVPQKTIRHASPFIERSGVFGNGETPQWAARNRMNTFILWGNPGVKYGGGFRQGPDMHTFFRLIGTGELKHHPDWVAEVDGKRLTVFANNNWGLCLSNPVVRRILIDRTLAYLRKHPEINTVWMGQNDGSPYCTCEKCKKFYAEHGNHPSSMMIMLLNELAGAMGKEFPNIRIKTLSYGWTQKPPKNIKLSDRVTVVLCAQHGDYMARIGKEKCFDSFLQNYEGWKKVAKNFEIYLYSYPTDCFWFPTPSIFSQAHNIKWAAKHGFSSVHMELFGVGTGLGGEFIDLRSWLYHQLFWNPSLSPKKLVIQFCRDYYGKYAGTVLDVIKMTEQTARKKPAAKTSSLTVPKYINPYNVRKCNIILKKAYDSCTDPVLKKRLGYIWLPYLWADFWQGFKSFGKYNSSTGKWQLGMDNPEQRKVWASKIKQLMHENKVSALRYLVKLNPNQLKLEGFCKSYKAYKVGNSAISVVCLPGCLGKLVEMKDSVKGFEPLKTCWGFQLFQYPTVGSWSEWTNGLNVNNYRVVNHSPSKLELTGSIPGYTVNKLISVDGDKLTQQITLKSSKGGPGKIMLLPMFDLYNAFGEYPVMYIEHKDHSWSKFEFGRAGKMWYQAGNIPIRNYTGKFLLVSTNGNHAVEFSIPPKQLGVLSYEYDRYNFPPEGTGKKLDLKLVSPVRKLSAGEKMNMSISFKIINNPKVPKCSGK